MFKFLTPYMTHIKIGIVIVLLGAIGILYLMMSHYKAENKVLSSQIEEARAANAENVKTIDSMKTDRNRASTLCSVRLTEKDRIIAELKKLYSPGGVSHENLISSGNALLDSLNSMYPKAGYKGGVCDAESSEGSDEGVRQPRDVLYCFSRQDALNLLSNKILHDGRENEMEEILNSFQGGKE